MQVQGSDLRPSSFSGGNYCDWQISAHLQVGFCAESKELEIWLKHCHDRLKREHSLPSRQDAAWLHEFDRIEQVCPL